jgi:hypothetical protein
VRSTSSDSSTDMQTPSPITPEFGFDDDTLPHQQFQDPVYAQHHQQHQQQSFFPSQKEMAVYAPVTHTTGPLPYHPSGAAFFGAPVQLEDIQNSPAAANPRTKKNSYPCPVAKQYNCVDFFTTSGHAARHAKKHTGKKDAFCPECNKAFTRKDNMEQHRRTHQSGRNAPKTAGDSQVKRPKQTAAKRPKASPLQSALPTFDPMPMVDPSLTASPTALHFAMAPAVQPIDYFQDQAQRSPYPDPTAFSMTHAYSAGSYNALNALAIAASGEKRKFES